MTNISITKIKKYFFIKKLLNYFFYIVFVFLFFFDAKANWTKVTQSSNGQSFYVDMENIIEIKGLVYFWELIDYKNEDEYGDKSAKIYIKADCTNLKFKWIKLSYHKAAMGKDKVKVQKPT